MNNILLASDIDKYLDGTYDWENNPDNIDFDFEIPKIRNRNKVSDFYKGIMHKCLSNSVSLSYYIEDIDTEDKCVQVSYYGSLCEVFFIADYLIDDIYFNDLDLLSLNLYTENYKPINRILLINDEGEMDISEVTSPINNVKRYMFRVLRNTRRTERIRRYYDNKNIYFNIEVIQGE